MSGVGILVFLFIVALFPHIYYNVKTTTKKIKQTSIEASLFFFFFSFVGLKKEDNKFADAYTIKSKQRTKYSAF
jgi:hypothetical protein